MKLGLQLAESSYDFESDERLSVYLTNTLEEAEETSKTLFAQWISEEARAANKVKKDLPIMVVLGNPPYAGHSANKSWEIVNGKKIPNFIGRLLRDYYQVDGQPLGERNPKWLQDDYVKFIRFGQHRIEQTGSGILAFITNHGYLDNPTFRGMRQQLMNTFSDIYILDLHGNQKKKETCPDGAKDVNVFDIQQGVSIGIFVKEAEKQEPAKIYHADLYGLRKNKYEWLSKNDIEKTNWKVAKPQKPFYLFSPKDEKLSHEYNDAVNICDILPVNTVGVVTGADGETIAFTEKNVCKLIKKKSLDEDCIKSILYRPFDKRYIVYDKKVVTRPRTKVMRHMLAGENLGLTLGRAGQVIDQNEWNIIFSTKDITEFNLFRRGGNNLFPLYLYPQEEKEGLFDKSEWSAGKHGRTPNLSVEFVKELACKIGLEFVSDSVGDLKKTFGPEDIFHYIYAIFHSPQYRKRYAEFLKIDFSRVPMPTGKEIFVRLCGVGERLSKLHLMEADILEDDTKWPAFEIEGSGEVEKGYPKYVAHADKSAKGKVYINKDQYFKGVKPEVWEFHVGGYQVCEKWLKDRRNRKLNYEDICHYQKITVALGETIKLMDQVDKVIDSNGGWPIE